MIYYAALLLVVTFIASILAIAQVPVLASIGAILFYVFVGLLMMAVLASALRRRT